MAAAPVSTTNRPLWITDLAGMIQRQDMDKIPDNNSPLLINISLSRPGTWMKRKGLDLLASTVAGVGTRGGIDYDKVDGTHIVHCIRSTDLDTYTSLTDAYAVIAAADFTGTARVQTVNYLQRTYWTGTDEFLRYSSGGATTTVLDSAGTPVGIKGNTLAVAQNTLFIGGVVKIGAGSVNYQNRVYYSRFDQNTGLGTHQFWETNSDNTFANSVRFFTTITPVNALFTFSNTGLVYAFTNDSCYSFDMQYEDTATGVKKEFAFGCVGPRAVTECNGRLIWMTPDRRIMGWDGSSAPQDLSWSLEDDANQEAIMNKIDITSISKIAAGALGNTFYFSIGNVTQYNEVMTNVLLVGLFNQPNTTVSWTTYQYPFRPSIFFTAIFDGEKVICFGNESNNNIYRMESGTNDDVTAISAKARTKFFHFNMPFDSKQSDLYLIKYRPQAALHTYLKVSTAEDGLLTYTALTDPDAATPVTNHGIVDMYTSDASTRLDAVKRFENVGGAIYRSQSLEFANTQLSESFAISGFGMTVQPEELDIRIAAS